MDGVLEALRKMDDEFDRALESAVKGENDAAVGRLALAVDLKREAIEALPGLEVEPGVRLPFFPLYDLFTSIDEYALAVGDLAGALEGTPAPTPDDLRALRAKLGEALDELKANLRDKFDFADRDAARALDEISQSLLRLQQILDDLIAGQRPPPYAEIVALTRVVAAAKRRFLDTFRAPLPLWDVYALLFELDALIALARRQLLRNYPVDSRLGRRARELVREVVIPTKEKLEDLLKGRPKPPEGSEPGAPGGQAPGGGGGLPEQPEPKYPPGSEDLPPYPPGLGGEPA